MTKSFLPLIAMLLIPGLILGSAPVYDIETLFRSAVSRSEYGTFCAQAIPAHPVEAFPAGAVSSELWRQQKPVPYALDRDLLRRLVEPLVEEVRRGMQGEAKRYPYSYKFLALIAAAFQPIVGSEKIRVVAGMRLPMHEPPDQRSIYMSPLGVPQEVVSTRLLRLIGRTLPAYFGGGAFEVMEAVVPFVGDLIGPNAQALTSDHLRRLNLEWVVDETGEPLKIPALAQGIGSTRKVTLPLPYPVHIHIVTEEGRQRWLLTLDDMEAFIERHYGEDVLKRLRQESRDGASQSGVSAEHPSAMQAETVRYVIYQKMRSWLVEQGFKQAVPVIAIQYKGVGTRYRGQIVPSEFLPEYEGSGWTVETPEFELPGIPSIALANVLNPDFAGKEGVLLQPYREGERVPIGAVGAGELRTVERDRELLEAGALLSAVDVGAVPFLDAEQMRMMGLDAFLDSTAISVRWVLDDTRQLSDVANNPGSYDHFLVHEIDPDRDRAIQIHQGRLASDLGTNLAACLRTGYTLSFTHLGLVPHLGYVTNVSPWGLLRDTGDLIPIQRPQEALFIMRAMFDALLYTGRQGGMDLRTMAAGEPMLQMVHAFLNDLSLEKDRTLVRNAHRALQDMARAATEDDAYFMLHALLRVLWNGWMVHTGRPVRAEDEAEFRRSISDIPIFADFMKLGDSPIAEAARPPRAMDPLRVRATAELADAAGQEYVPKFQHMILHRLGLADAAEDGAIDAVEEPELPPGVGRDRASLESALAAATGFGHRRQRVTLAGALMRIDPESAPARQALIEGLQDLYSPVIRSIAVHALHGTHDPEAIAALLNQLKGEPSFDVRQAIVAALTSYLDMPSQHELTQQMLELKARLDALGRPPEAADFWEYHWPAIARLAGSPVQASVVLSQLQDVIARRGWEATHNLFWMLAFASPNQWETLVSAVRTGQPGFAVDLGWHGRNHWTFISPDQIEVNKVAYRSFEDILGLKKEAQIRRSLGQTVDMRFLSEEPAGVSSIPLSRRSIVYRRALDESHYFGEVRAWESAAERWASFRRIALKNLADLYALHRLGFSHFALLVFPEHTPNAGRFEVSLGHSIPAIAWALRYMNFRWIGISDWEHIEPFRPNFSDTATDLFCWTMATAAAGFHSGFASQAIRELVLDGLEPHGSRKDAELSEILDRFFQALAVSLRETDEMDQEEFYPLFAWLEDHVQERSMPEHPFQRMARRRFKGAV